MSEFEREKVVRGLSEKESEQYIYSMYSRVVDKDDAFANYHTRIILRATSGSPE